MTAPAIPIHEFSEEVFRAVVNQHARWLFASAYRQLRDRHLAEDAVQSVFVLLIRRSRTMPPPEKLSGWLFNTLAYTVKNLRRSLRRRAHYEAAAARPPEEVAMPETVSELALQLDSAVARLGESERTAILMRFYQDLSYDEIAATLGITEPAARKRVSRAAEILRGRLGAQATTAALAAAAVYGFTDAPAALAATSVSTALAAQTGATLPASIAAATKGTLFMALTKAQGAAIAVAVAALVAVPVTLVTLQHQDKPAPAPPPAAVAQDPVVTWYGLEAGQVARIVQDAPAETRTAMWRMLQIPNTNFPAPKGHMIFDWHNGTPQSPVVMMVSEVPMEHAVMQLCALVLNVKPPQIQIKATMPNEPFKLTGDLVYNSAFSAAESAPLLEKAIEEAFRLRVKVTVTEAAAGVVGAETKVVVEDRPDPLVQFKLAEGQVLRRFADQPEDVRNAWWNSLNSGMREMMSPLPGAFMARGKSTGYSGWTRALKGTFTLGDLLEYMADTYPQEIEGEGVAMKVPGDFVGREDASQEELRAALEAMLRQELKVQVTLAYREVERKVIVFKGDWSYTPAPGGPRQKQAPAPIIEVYEHSVLNQGVSGHGGDPRRFAGTLGRYLRQQILLEANGLPKSFCWMFNESDEVPPQSKAAVLNHLTEQTGLAWSEENRLVKRLFIEQK